MKNARGCSLTSLFAAGLLSSLALQPCQVRALQPPDVVWARQGGGPQTNRVVDVATENPVLYDWTTAMVVDAQGNAFVAGHFIGMATFGTNVLSASRSDDMDMFLVKYGPNGDVLWVRQAGGAADDEALSLALDGSGGVYLLGGLNLQWTDPIGYPTGPGYSSLSGLPASVAGVTITNNSDWAPYWTTLLLARFDSNGNVLWANAYGASQTPSLEGGDMTGSIASDPAGNIYLAVYYAVHDHSLAQHPSVLDFGGLAFTNYAAGLADDAFSAKFDPSGKIVWLKPSNSTVADAGFAKYQYRSPGWYFNAIAADSQENVYLFGDYSEYYPPTPDFNPGPNLQFVIKTDVSGTVIWGAAAPGGYIVKTPVPVAVDNLGNTYIAQTVLGNGSGFVIKRDPYGHEVGRWTSTTVPLALAANPLGGVYVAGAYDLQPFAVSDKQAFGWGLFSLDATLAPKWNRFFPAAGGVWAPLSSAPLGLGPKGELYYAGTFLNELYLGGAWLKSPEAGYDVRDFIMKLVTPLTNALPLITSQPVGDTLIAGDTIKLEVVASSVSPLSYQWFFKGQSLTGATNRIYVFTNAQAAAAGSYAVRVGNAQGTTNSTPAVISVIPTTRLAEAVGATNLTWSVGGDRGWRIETNMAHASNEAAVSGMARHKEEIDFDTGVPIFTENLFSWVQTTVTGPGSLSFWWKVSSDTNELATTTDLPGDQLSVIMDGTNIDSISGDVDWQQRTLNVSPGLHTIQWNYTHFNGDYDDSDWGSTPTALPRPWIGYDSGWLAEVQFLPAGAGGAPQITSAHVAADGSFQISVSGPPASTFGVEASTDLVNWLPVGQVYSDTGTFTFTHKVPSGLGKNFYRIRQNP